MPNLWFKNGFKPPHNTTLLRQQSESRITHCHFTAENNHLSIYFLSTRLMRCKKALMIFDIEIKYVWTIECCKFQKSKSKGLK